MALKFLAMGYHAAVLRYSCAPAEYPTSLKALGKKGSGMLFCVGSLYLAGELKAYLAKRNG